MSELLAGRSVLVVEDEMLIVLMIEDMLADLGCNSVATAATVDQALRHIDENAFDVALLDMNLAGDSSETVANALAAHSVPFIYSTGNTNRDIMPDHRDRPVLRKPFRFDALREMLAAAITAD